MEYFVTAIISYLLGTINAAYFIGKAHGFDIRERGSHNAGASNIKVNFGWGAAAFTCLCDMFKAIVAVKLCAYLYPDNEIIPFLAGAMAVIGHIFPFYMGFRGGKGFASYLGMLIALDWKFALVAMAATAVVSLITNYIVAGTLMVMVMSPIYFFCSGANTVGVIIVSCLSLLIIWKHRINIRRIIKHEEMVIFDRNKKKDQNDNEQQDQ